MKLASSLIIPVSAQTSGTSHPTIPYTPPWGPSVTPTVGPTIATGPTMYLYGSKHDFGVQEKGTLAVYIDTKGVEIDEFKIVIEYDPTHIQIQDDDSTLAGTQITYLDTHFIPTSNGNIVEKDITSSESGMAGRITIYARARDDEARTISNRSMAEINFTVISSKTSELTFAKNTSTLLLDSTNQLETDTLQTYQIRSTLIQPTVRPTITPTPNKINTSISDNLGNFAIISSGLLLIAAGFYLKQKITKFKK